MACTGMEKKKRSPIRWRGLDSCCTSQGRKKADVESRTTVGSVAKAVVEDKLAKKKHREIRLGFYRSQRRDA